MMGYLNVNTHQSIICFSDKGKVKIKFTLEQATEAQKGSRGIALVFL